MARRGIKIARIMAGIAARSLSSASIGAAFGIGAASGVGVAAPSNALELNGELLQLDGQTLTLGA